MQKNATLKIEVRIITLIVAIMFLGTAINLVYGQNNSENFLVPTAIVNPVNRNNQVYPSPMEYTSKIDLTSAYPPPGGTDTPIDKPTSMPIPKDRIVALSNTGEIIDFNVEASFARKY